MARASRSRTRTPAGRAAAGAASLPEVVASDHLAPYAQRAAATRGRRYAEPPHPYRSPYQRDRDRIIHCRAFRRLEYKTQVFVNDEGDHYRTRLTHSIEVSQIGRTVARALALNEDLVEALALSHDLGHTPFGHVGEDVLEELMAGHGGFEHNRQTLRIVDRLEERYPDFPGLNLTWEVREGIAKHSGPIDIQAAPEFAEYAPEEQPPVETQLLDLVDEIAYNHHDIDDGLEAGILEIAGLRAEVPLFSEPFEAARRRYPAAELRQWRKLALHGVLTRLVDDLIGATRASIVESGVGTVEEVRAAGRSLVRLSPEVAEQNRVLKTFLRERLYRHPRIERMRDEARRILRALYAGYLENPRLLPEETRRRAGEEGLPRTVADYVAGMTDRYAHEEYRRLHDPTVRA